MPRKPNKVQNNISKECKKGPQNDIIVEALRTFRKEERERRKKRQFQNMQRLMESYLDFIELLERIQYKADSNLSYLENLDFEVSELNEVNVQSIMRSKVRTEIMVSHIEGAVALLKSKMERRGEYEKYQVIKLLYMDPDKKDFKITQRLDIVADEIKCHKDTVRRWNNEMLNELSKFIFGVDGLRMDI